MDGYLYQETVNPAPGAPHGDPLMADFDGLTLPDYYGMHYGLCEYTDVHSEAHVQWFQWDMPRGTRVTSYLVTDYAAQPWGSEQTTVTLTSKNGYWGAVYLEANESGGTDAIQKTLGNSAPGLVSSASTTFTLKPKDGTKGSLHPVTVSASDSNGRFVGSAVYNLDLTSNKPDPTTAVLSTQDYWGEVPQATLTVQTTPVNGPVSVNGTSWGTAPQTRTVSPGTYTVAFDTITKYDFIGYKINNGGLISTTNRTVAVTLAAGESKTVTGVYETPAPGQAKLTIQSRPINVQVELKAELGTYLNEGNSLKSSTPWGPIALDNGSYKVIAPATASGYELDHYEVDGVNVGTNTTMIVTLAAGDSKTVTVVYTLPQPDFSISVTPNVVKIITHNDLLSTWWSAEPASVTVQVSNYQGLTNPVNISADPLSSNTIYWIEEAGLINVTLRAMSLGSSGNGSVGMNVVIEGRGAIGHQSGTTFKTMIIKGSCFASSGNEIIHYASVTFTGLPIGYCI